MNFKFKSGDICKYINKEHPTSTAYKYGSIIKILSIWDENAAYGKFYFGLNLKTKEQTSYLECNLEKISPNEWFQEKI